MLENKQHQEAIKMLIKALKMAKEGRWKTMLSHSFIQCAGHGFPKSKVEIAKGLNGDYFLWNSKINAVNTLADLTEAEMPSC